ncbi:MAG: phosphoribosyl-AMP cyclohydrolase, partial [Candidatus Puniceispirillaceae bacterium]
MSNTKTVQNAAPDWQAADWNKGGGLLPAIIQDAGTGQVLMLGYMNLDAAMKTAESGKVTFFSRSKQRLWTKGEEGGLLPFPPAEIEAADLAGLALELAAWGATPDDLPFLTQPPLGTFNEAQGLLQMLGILDEDLRITDHGVETT